MDDDEVYYMNIEIIEEEWKKEKICWDLEAGSYRLNDGVISLVGENDNDDFFDPFDYDDNEEDYDEYDLVLNEVSKSALKVIGVDNEDEQNIKLMGHILIGISSEESDDTIVGSAYAQLVLSGFMLPKEDIKEMCRKTRENCKKQLFG